MKKTLVIVGIFLALLNYSCKDLEPEVINNGSGGSTSKSIPDSVLVVNEWIFDVMDDVYLWRTEMPTNIDNSKEQNPADYFYKLIVEKDRWSFIIEDTKELDKLLNNESKSFGFSFRLFLRSQNGNKVIGIVEYVAKDSPASLAGVKRGDIFYSINGTEITTDNYRTLLDNDSYTLQLADMKEEGLIVPNNKSVSMDAIEFKEDPLLLTQVVEVADKKIGYLLYNSFVYSEQDSINLVESFQFLKEQNIDDLVLDLRYNGGGSTLMANLLASMLAPASVAKNEEIFYRYLWNSQYNAYFINNQGSNSPNLVSRFIDVPVNLNLSKFYALTLGGTASASELVLHGLQPYMNHQITLIGDTTHGKYTVSIPIDDEQDGFRHNYAMLPIVAKYANKEGVTDFNDGLVPEFVISDDYWDELGNPDEALFQKAISLITGIEITGPDGVAPLTKKSTVFKPLSKKGVRRTPLDGFLIDERLKNSLN